MSSLNLSEPRLNIHVQNMPTDRTFPDERGLTLRFPPLAIRPKKQNGSTDPPHVEPSRRVRKRHLFVPEESFHHIEPSDEDDNQQDMVPGDDDFLFEEDSLRSHAQRRVQRRQAKRRAGGNDRILRATIGGRVGKARSAHKIQSCEQEVDDTSGGRMRRLLPSRQFLRRKPSMAITACIPSTEIQDAILAIPGFSLSMSVWEENNLAPRLGYLLADPHIVRKCGRSLKRRRLPNFIIMMLAFPIRMHHGRGAFERDCGYAPGDENNPDFWRRFAAAFSAWLGLDSDGLDPFQDGVLLRDLIAFFSSARVHFLEYDCELGLPLQGSSKEEPLDMEGYQGHVSMGTQARQKLQPTQLQRRVSVATDAWMLFLDKSRDNGFDLEKFAAMCI